MNQNNPRISIVLPYEMKMKNETVLFNLLLTRADRAERELLFDFSEETVKPVIKKLRRLIKTIKCPTHEKNIAIFISSCTEKVYYFTPSHLEKYKLPVLIKNPHSS